MKSSAKSTGGFFNRIARIPQFFENSSCIGKTRANLLVVHGRKDRVVPVEHGIDLMKVGQRLHRPTKANANR